MFENNKWIQKYTLRYGVGTVFGAFLVAYLWGFDGDKSIQSIESVFDGISTPKVFALLGAGFAFSFIASAPLYVVHAARFALFSSCRFSNRKWKFWLCIALFTVPLFCIICGFQFPLLNFMADWMKFLTLVPVVSMGLAEYVLVSCMIAKVNFIKSSTDTVSKWRVLFTSKDCETPRGEFVSTVKDGRENGNAFGIVFVQTSIFLAALALDPHELNLYCWGAAIALWVLPAWLTMYIYSLIEMEAAGVS